MPLRVRIELPAAAVDKLIRLQADADAGHPEAIRFARELKEQFGVDVESIRLVPPEELTQPAPRSII